MSEHRHQETVEALEIFSSSLCSGLDAVVDAIEHLESTQDSTNESSAEKLSTELSGISDKLGNFHVLNETTKILCDISGVHLCGLLSETKGINQSLGRIVRSMELRHNGVMREQHHRRHRLRSMELRHNWVMREHHRRHRHRLRLVRNITKTANGRKKSGTLRRMGGTRRPLFPSEHQSD